MSLIKNRFVDMTGALQVWVEISPEECIICKAHSPTSTEEELEKFAQEVHDSIILQRSNPNPEPLP